MTTGPQRDPRVPAHSVPAPARSVHASLTLSGDLDHAASDSLAVLFESHHHRGRRFIWVDLCAVTFLDGSCLGVLVSAHNRLIALSGMLLLEDVGPVVDRALTATGLDERLFVFRPVPGSDALSTIAAPARTRWGELVAPHLALVPPRTC